MTAKKLTTMVSAFILLAASPVLAQSAGSTGGASGSSAGGTAGAAGSTGSSSTSTGTSTYTGRGVAGDRAGTSSNYGVTEGRAANDVSPSANGTASTGATGSLSTGGRLSSDNLDGNSGAGIVPGTTSGATSGGSQ